MIVNRLIQTGTVGVTLRRQFEGSDRSEFGFVASPFFVGLGELPPSQDDRATAIGVAVQAGYESAPSLDPRLIEPADLDSWDFDQEPSGPYRFVGGSSARSADERRWERALALGRGRDPDLASGAPVPRLWLHAFEFAAYADRSPRWAGRVMTAVPPAAPNAFLPRHLEVRYALDKPGAQIIHQFQPMQAPVGAGADSVGLGRLLDAGLRDPQRLSAARGAALSVDQASVSKNSLFAEGLFDLSLAWTERLGAVPLAGQPLGSLSLRFARGVYVLDFGPPADGVDKAPFVLIAPLNDELVVAAPTTFDLPLQVAALAPEVHPPLFLVTAVDRIDEPVTAPTDPEERAFRPVVRVTVRSQAAEEDTTFEFTDAFEHDASSRDGFHLWKARDAFHAAVGSWSRVSALRFLWLHDATDPAIELPVGSHAVRPIPYAAVAPRIAAVLSAIETTPETGEERRVFERTALVGESADADRGVGAIKDVAGICFVFERSSTVLASTTLVTPEGSQLVLDLLRNQGDGPVVASPRHPCPIATAPP